MNKLLLEKDKLTTIAVSQENYDKLSRLGFTNESFNDVITRLIALALEANREEED